jgi:hypothetical protein
MKSAKIIEISLLILFHILDLISIVMVTILTSILVPLVFGIG